MEDSHLRFHYLLTFQLWVASKQQCQLGGHGEVGISRGMLTEDDLKINVRSRPTATTVYIVPDLPMSTALFVVDNRVLTSMP